MPKVSIIVPVYNTEKYLEKCLDSIVSQTYKNIEIILVNDGSTDNSENIIKAYVERYPDKIKYFVKTNGGLSDARNFGVNHATGDYIAFIDSDDYLNKDLLASLEEYMKDNNDLIKYKMIKVDEDGNKIEKVNGPIFENKTGEEAFDILRIDDVLMVSACLYLFNTKFYMENDFKFTKNTYYEDFGLIPLIILKAKRTVSTDVYGYYYVQSGNSITRDNEYTKTLKRANDMFIHYDNMLNVLENYNISNKSKENIKLYFTNAILLKTVELKKYDKKQYIKNIKKRKMLDNIKIVNFKQLLKKILLKINVNLYLKLR